MHKDIYTERELIELFDGSEFKTAAWKERGYLKNNGTLQKLIKKAETKYHKVEVVGSSSGRRYECSNPKEVVTSIEDKRKNNKGVTPNESKIMTGHIFNRLKSVIGKGGSWSNTKGAWIELMDLIDMNPNDLVELTEELESVYLPLHETINISSMRRESKQNVDTRLHDVFNYSIGKLVKDGLIQIEDDYKSKLTNEQYEHDKHYASLEGDEASPFKDLKNFELESIREAEREELEQFGVIYNDYFMARVFPSIATKEALATLEYMDEMLQERFGIEFYYKSIRITVLKPREKMNVTHEQARKAFSDRLITLTNKRQNGQKYSNADTYAKKFYRLNMFMLLKIKGIEGLEEEIEKEKSTIKKRIGEVQSCYFNNDVQIEDVQEEDNRPWAWQSKIDIQKLLPTLFDKTESTKEAQVINEPDLVEVKPTNKTEEVVKIVNEELEYLNRFKPRKKIERVVKHNPGDFKAHKTKNYIDIEDEELMKEWQPLAPVKEIQTFGEMLGSKEAVAEPIKDNKPSFAEHGSLYLMELEKYWNSEAI